MKLDESTRKYQTDKWLRFTFVTNCCCLTNFSTLCQLCNTSLEGKLLLRSFMGFIALRLFASWFIERHCVCLSSYFKVISKSTIDLMQFWLDSPLCFPALVSAWLGYVPLLPISCDILLRPENHMCGVRIAFERFQ